MDNKDILELFEELDNNEKQTKKTDIALRKQLLNDYPETLSLYQVGGLKAVKAGHVNKSPIFKSLKSKGNSRYGS